MTYTKQTFTSGQILKASDLNTMSEGITSKQDTLVSGTNLKTINGQSLLGSVTVTMGGEDISSYFVDGVLSIPSVTGDVEITAVATMVAPIVDLDFTSVDGGVLVNNGSGGATYNATLSTVNATDVASPVTDKGEDSAPPFFKG